MSEKFLKSFLHDVNKYIDKVSLEKVEQFVDTIFEAYKKDKQVFIMGNGGSAATASHFACDLSMQSDVRGKPRLRAISLNDNTSVITALSNDFGYEQMFREQLINLVNKEDVVISISCSGQSQNVINAADYARAKGAVNIGLLGFEGGKLKDLMDNYILVDHDNFGVVETVHQALEHLISAALRQKIQKG